MLEELEIRINYTEAQILQVEKDLRKAQDELKFLEGQKIAYKDLLEHMRAGKCR